MARLVIGTVALLLVLAGCGGEPSSTAPSPSSASSLSSPSLPSPSSPPASATAPSPGGGDTTPHSSSAPAMPQQASADTRAGAIAFVRYYVGLINHLQSTGDDAPLRSASEKDCRACEAVVAAATSLYAAGGRVDGGAWSIGSTVASHPTQSTWVVQITGQLAPSTFTRSGSGTPTTRPGATANAKFVLTFDKAWKVKQWQPA